jgi:hypothetical protein
VVRDELERITDELYLIELAFVESVKRATSGRDCAQVMKELFEPRESA